MRESIDIFNIHQKIMDDYKHFVGSFTNIKYEKIKEVVENKNPANRNPTSKLVAGAVWVVHNY